MCDFSCYSGTSPEWLALQQILPPSVLDLPLDELKRLANQEREATSAKSMIHLSHKVYTHDYAIPSRDGSFIEARSYRPRAALEKTLPVYIHLQGGGFIAGTLSSEDAICSRIACGSEVVVVNVDYRHTPEFKYPAQWNDAEDAFEWVHDNIKSLGGDDARVVLGGISAGAWIASSLTLQRHINRSTDKRPPIAGQVLMIPCLTHVDCREPQFSKMAGFSVSSYHENRDAPLLSVEELRWFTSLLQIENPDPTDLKMNPGNATTEQVKGLPPTVLGIVGLDPLRDEALLYAKMLTEAG